MTHHRMTMSPLYAGVEAGGTKFVCVVGTGPDDIRAETRLPTTTPGETLRGVVDFLRLEQQRLGKLNAAGIASFGPVDLRDGSDTYGHVTSTPKAGWSNVDIVGALRTALELPVGFDTDVNAAALAESRWGATRGLDTSVYLTVGTGIGGGALVGGRLVHGLMHPEMGHMRVPHDRATDPFEGICPFHTDCLEGLASGPAIAARWGQAPEQLGDAHPAWGLESNYLALALVTIVCVLSPQRIVMGGGVMRAPHLLPLVRNRLLGLLNGYVRASEILDDVERYVVGPTLGERAGVLGALALAESAATGHGLSARMRSVP